MTYSSIPYRPEPQSHQLHGRWTTAHIPASSRASPSLTLDHHSDFPYPVQSFWSYAICQKNSYIPKSLEQSRTSNHLALVSVPASPASIPEAGTVLAWTSNPSLPYLHPSTLAFPVRKHIPRPWATHLQNTRTTRVLRQPVQPLQLQRKQAQGGK